MCWLWPAKWSIPRDSNPQQPRCKRGTLTNCVRNRKARHSSCVPEVVDIKINFAVCAVNGWSRQNRTVECMCIRHVCFPPSPCSNKQDACNNAIYWIRTNVSSIAASALTTKLNARMVDTNVTLLYASSNSTRSKWPNHYDSLLYQLSYVLTFFGEDGWTQTSDQRLEMQNEHCCMDLKWVSERINLSTWQCHASSPRLY